MKNNKLFLKIYISLLLICILTLIILPILGNISRIGYLSEFQLNEIQSSEGNYYYNCRIKYHSKVFRNNDIYDVYLNTNKILQDNNYIKEIKMGIGGSPFGNLISEKKLEYNEKIDNINYKLKLKLKVLLIAILIFIIIMLLYLLYDNNLINKLKTKRLFLLIPYRIILSILTSISLILYILFNIPINGKLSDLELVTESKLGYVYKMKFSDNGIFRPDPNKKLFFKDKPNYINYGYSIEINRMPDWYDTSIGVIWTNEDYSFSVSNCSTWNTYNYIMPLSDGEKYKVSIYVKKTSGNIDKPIYFYLGKNNHGYIANTENIINEYNKYSCEIDIKDVLQIEHDYLLFSFPNAVLNIKSIKIEQIVDGTYIKNGNEIIITSSKKIDDISSIKNIKYYMDKKIDNIFLILIFISSAILLLLSYKYKKIMSFIMDLFLNKLFINILSLLFIILSIGLILFYFFSNKKLPLFWDTINYISRGIDIFYGRQVFTYPGTLFSIINTIPTLLLFGHTQISHVIYMSIIPASIILIFLYKILKKHIDKYMSISILLLIFIIFPSYIPVMITQPYTDVWLLMFIVLSIYFILNNKIYISAILMAISYFFRSSLAMPLCIFIPLLLPDIDNIKTLLSKKNIISYIKYFITLIICIYAIQFILDIFVKKQVNANEYEFYFNYLQKINIKEIFNSFLLMLKGFYISTVPGIILSLLSIFFITRVKLNIELKKISLLGIIYFIICSLLTIMLILSGYKPFVAENRYFIYPILILLISNIPLLYQYINNYFNINKFRNILIISIFIISILKTIYSINPYFLYQIHYYDYSTDYPKIKENASICIIDSMPKYTLNYIFKNQSINNNSDFNFFNEFYNNDNSKYEYIFSNIGANYPSVIEDKYGNKFELIWMSTKGIKYALYINKEYIK